MSQVYILMTHT